MNRIISSLLILIVSLGARKATTAPAEENSANRVIEPILIPPATEPASRPTTRPAPGIERALVISVDGLRPDLLLRADTPVMHKLFESGCYSFWARTTAISITLPSHVSMLTGATPNRHEIMWNSELPFSRPVYPKVPTLFEYAHRAGYTTAMAVGKSKFTVVNKPGAVDWFFIPAVVKIDDARVAVEAIRIIHEHKPEVMFIHFPGADSVGHKVGWGTPEQIKAIEGIDAAIGRVLAALQEEKILDSTFILLSADHGGAGRTHGPDDARSRHIPWIAVGPGIRKNIDLTTYPKLEINTEDTFATVCWLMGIPTDSKNLDGKPIVEILDRNELLVPAAR
ncbi:MAG TPA: ectonucleotide pyrophosphatase/phosphodiesterase [Tepidisphaeraceae bacterium]|jgi:hypothetical protein|nr:ectonucleotide pyrophosphatase/phosphodiesterase [Tepidisphaeraceae bacterium]